jgi:hypothetical protein
VSTTAIPDRFTTLPDEPGRSALPVGSWLPSRFTAGTVRGRHRIPVIYRELRSPGA